ncbi:hypothetical protein D3C87_1858180 [compost metagenome]
MVRVSDAQFGDVLDRDDALVHRRRRKERREQRGLARTGGTGHQQVRAAGHGLIEAAAHGLVEHAGTLQIVEGRETAPRHADRQEGGVGRDRREDGVHPDAVVEAHVDAR